jgi:pseudouridine-5'-phosphate glycosidase
MPRMSALAGLPLVVTDEVSDAIASGQGVVALESTIISHGLPTETAAATARRIEDAVRRAGSVPATIAVLDGAVHVGLDDQALVRVAEEPDVVKSSLRDLGVVLARKLTGATTVAATSRMAHLAGIRIFATGGLGGVHRDAEVTWDESADLAALASVPVTVVCAGVKSILDVPATLERLESLSVTVVGYRTRVFPGFYVADSGSRLDWSVADPEQAAAVFAARRGLAPGAVVVANPLPADEQLDPALHHRVIADALAAAERAGVRGKAVTPFILDHLHRASGGATLAVNVRLVLRNAELAGRIAAELAAVRL